MLLLTECTLNAQQPTHIFWEEGDISFFSTRSIIEGGQLNEKLRLFLINESDTKIAYVDDVFPILTYRVAWSPNGEDAALVTYDESIDSICLVIRTINDSRCIDINGRTSSWSQDGRWLVSHHKSIAGELPKLYLIDVETGTKSILTILNHSDEDVYSSWSPDSNRIAYDNYTKEGVGEIWLTNLFGDSYFLTQGTQPAWSPTANKIAL